MLVKIRRKQYILYTYIPLLEKALTTNQCDVCASSFCMVIAKRKIVSILHSDGVDIPIVAAFATKEIALLFVCYALSCNYLLARVISNYLKSCFFKSDCVQRD